jgi:hypothetical protein
MLTHAADNSKTFDLENNMSSRRNWSYNSLTLKRPASQPAKPTCHYCADTGHCEGLINDKHCRLCLCLYPAMALWEQAVEQADEVQTLAWMREHTPAAVHGTQQYGKCRHIDVDNPHM